MNVWRENSSMVFSSRRAWLSLCITLFFLTDVLVGQGTQPTPLDQYNLRSWSTKDGLPNNKIVAICQSAEGYVWFATQEGLVRFDGARFEVFDRKNTQILPHSGITALIEDKDSTLWIGTIRGMVKRHHGVISAVPVEEGIEPFVCNSFYIDRVGTLLVGTRDGILRIRDGRATNLDIPVTRPGVSVYAMCEDLTGRFWIGTSLGLKLLSDHNVKDVTPHGMPPGTSVTALCFRRDSTMWVGTSSGLFYRRLRDPINRFERMKELSDQYIGALYEDRAGCLWIGTQKSGLYRYGAGRLEEISTKEGLSADDVLSLLEDREGNIWAGTYYNGVNEIWRGKFETISTEEGLAGPQVRAIAEADDGTVWIGTGSGLSRLKSGRIKNYTTKDGLPHDEIRSVYPRGGGIVWLGTMRGLSRFDGNKFTNYTLRDGISQEYARAVTEDFDGNIWIGYADNGVDRFRSGKFVNMSKEGIPPRGIRVLYRGRDRTMWIGTNMGVIRWRDGKSRMYSKEDGLTQDVFAIYEDADRTVWLGSYGDGLFRLKDEKVTRITTQDGLFDDVVYQILEDDQQNLWMTSNKGIFRVSRRQLNELADRKITVLTSVSYGTADGMRSSECNGNSQPAGIRTKDGRLWFATTNGVAIMNPADIALNAIPPEVTIESLQVDSALIDLLKPVIIGPGYSHLEILYSGLSFIVPEKLMFKFMLDGYDKDWRDVGTRRVAYYTNIPPGSYTFRVKARNNDGIWSKEPASLPIELRPHFYQAGWFFVVIGFLLVGSVFVVYRWRIRFLLEREKELQKRVNETLAQMKILGGLIPICSNCKKIRDDKGYWNQIEKYLKEHSEAQFTHGICPECHEKLYGSYLRGLKKET